MSSRSVRRTLAPCLLAAAVALAGCGRGAPDVVATGSGGQEPGSPTTSSPAPAMTAPEVVPADPSATTTTAPATTTTIASDPIASDPTTPLATGTEGDPSPSTVPGLSPDEVKAAVLAPASATVRRAPGATVERLTLPSGVAVWRIRIPGSFPARSARVTVSVGGREVGAGTTSPTLDALVAVTTDGSGLVAGARVSFRWEGSEPVAAGALAVVR